MAMMFDDSSTFIAIGRWLCVMCEVRMGSLHSRSSFNMAIRKAPLCTYRSTWPYEKWSCSQGFLNFIVKEFRAVTLVYSVEWNTCPSFCTRRNVDTSSPSWTISRPLVLRKRFSAILLWTDNVFLVSAPNTSIPSSTAATFDLQISGGVRYKDAQDLWCWGKGLVPSSCELIMFF